MPKKSKRRVRGGYVYNPYDKEMVWEPAPVKTPRIHRKRKRRKKK